MNLNKRYHGRGRTDQVGSGNANAKLNDEKVLSIMKSTSTIKELCAEFAVTPTTVRNIRNKKSWVHLTNATPQKL